MTCVKTEYEDQPLSTLVNFWLSAWTVCVYDNVNVFYEPPPALSASYIQPMVWHHSISYQFNCTCVLCVNTERAWNDDEVPDSAACLQCCSAAVYTDHSHQSRVGFTRTENTAGQCSGQQSLGMIHHHCAPTLRGRSLRSNTASCWQVCRHH